MDGIPSLAHVVVLALQAGLPLLEHLWLGDPLPELLEPLMKQLRSPGATRAPKRRKPLPYGATLVAESPPPPTDADHVPGDAFDDLLTPAPLTPIVSERLDSGHQPWGTPEQVAEAIASGELERPEPPSLPIGVTDDDIQTAAIESIHVGVDLAMKPPAPTVVVADHIEKMIGDETVTLGEGGLITAEPGEAPREFEARVQREVDAMAAPAAAGTKLVRFEQPTEPVSEVFNDDGTVTVVEPTNDDPADLDPPPPPKADPMVCEHGVRLDAKLQCNLCSPFG